MAGEIVSPIATFPRPNPRQCPKHSLLNPTSISLFSGFTSGYFIWRFLSLILNTGRHIWDSNIFQLKQRRFPIFQSCKPKQTTTPPNRRRLKLRSQISRTVHSCYSQLWLSICVTFFFTVLCKVISKSAHWLMRSSPFLPFRMVFG